MNAFTSENLSTNPVCFFVSHIQMSIQENYRNNPFHNFRHCFCVTQMVFLGIFHEAVSPRLTPPNPFARQNHSVCWTLSSDGYRELTLPPLLSLQMFTMIHLCKLPDKVTKKDLLVLMTASVCHDLDHPGYNNTYVSKRYWLVRLVLSTEASAR